ncbi:MAG: acetoacetate decarboxylase family protein [Candidatus Thorarchaeota archaeon]|jgi:acetoacetate decarboxylase
MPKRFSTPLKSPLYPPPPYNYKDAKIFLALFNPTVSSIKKILPKPLRPSQLPLAGVMTGIQPCVETGIFTESALLVQCMFDNPETGEDEVGVYFAHVYVDTDIALASGREIWGYPRKLADIGMKWKGDTLEATTVRDGNRLFYSKCTFDEEGEWIDSGPNVNVKRIPSVTGKGFDVSFITAAYLKYDIQNGRSGEVEIEITSGPDDDLSTLEIEAPMIGLYFDCDIFLPPGKVVAKL